MLGLPELKSTKPLDTRWLSHEGCVSAVKRCYGAIVTTLEQIIYKESHESEALGLRKILTRSSTVLAIYFILSQMSKLSECLQSQNVDLTIVSSHVDATLHTLDKIIQPT